MRTTRRRILETLALGGAAVALNGGSAAQSLAAQGPAPKPHDVQPIRLTFEGLCMLHPTRVGNTVVQVDAAMLNPKVLTSGATLPKHWPVLSIPVQLAGSFSVEPDIIEPTYLHWNLSNTRIRTVVTTGAGTYAPAQGNEARRSLMSWNEAPPKFEETHGKCAGHYEARGVRWVPHMSEFGERVSADWNSASKATAVVSLTFGDFEKAGLRLSQAEKRDQTSWIFRRRDGDSKWKDSTGAPEGRIFKNSITNALGAYNEIMFEFSGGKSGYATARPTPMDPEKFDPVEQPIRFSNMAAPHRPGTGAPMHDFLAYYELTQVSGATTPAAARYFPYELSSCVSFKTIECGCCPPSVGE